MVINRQSAYHYFTCQISLHWLTRFYFKFNSQTSAALFRSKIKQKPHISVHLLTETNLPQQKGIFSLHKMTQYNLTLSHRQFVWKRTQNVVEIQRICHCSMAMSFPPVDSNRVSSHRNDTLVTWLLWPPYVWHWLWNRQIHHTELSLVTCASEAVIINDLC